MINEMMAECCGGDGKPDLNKMKMFMAKCGEQDFSEKQLAMMCQATRFSLEKHFCGPESKPDAKQLKQFMKVFMEDCECCAASKFGEKIL